MKCSDLRSAGRLGKGHTLCCKHPGVSRPDVFKSCTFAAHTKFVRRPITLTECVYVIFNACCQEDARFWDETCHGFGDDAVEGRVHCGDCCVKKSQRSTDINLQKRIDQALMWNFLNRLPYMALQAYLSERILLTEERWLATVFSSDMAFLQSARWETDLRWVVLNDFVGTPVARPITLAGTRPALWCFLARPGFTKAMTEVS